jgi:outer membrane protein insertion porin family
MRGALCLFHHGIRLSSPLRHSDDHSANYYIGPAVARAHPMTGKVVSGFALFAATVMAQAASYEDRKIVDIQFSPAQTLDASDLAKALPFKQGDPLHGEDVAMAIDNLFTTGRFEDIVVEAEPSGDGVLVRFRTELTWFFGGLTVEGKIPNPPSRTQIASTAELTLGTPFRDEDLIRVREAVVELFKSNGLYDAQVTPEVTRDGSAQQVFLTLRIAGQKRARYTDPVIQGETKLPNSTILKATGWQIPIVHWWRQVTALRTQKGVQGVLATYQNKDRLKARVELQKLDYEVEQQRVRPTLTTEPGPRVKVTSLEASVSKRVLKRYVPVFEEHAVDNDLLVEGKRNLIDYFQGRGYYDVDIDFRILPEKDDLQTIEYIISEGQRYKVAKVSLTGNHYFNEETIRERMYMQAASFTQRRGRYSEAFQRKDEENISNLYRSNGFRDVAVKCAVDRNYLDKTGQIAVMVTIVEGSQWIVDHLTVNGIRQVDRNDVISRLASAAGQPLADLNLATDRNTVLTYYYEQGFPDANFKADSEPSGTPHHVNVIYTVTEGDRKYVRGIIMSGLTRTRHSLVDKNITLKTGDPLSPVEQTDIQKNLYDLGIFARVDTAIQNPDGDTDRKYVMYNFEEANRYTLGVGFGAQVGRFGTPNSNNLSSPSGSTGFSPLVSLDVSRLNFLDLGHVVGFHTLYSNLEKRGSLTYQVPRFWGNRDRTATFTALYDNSLNVLTFASKRQEASLLVSQKFSKALSGQIRFAYRRVSVTNVVIPVLLVPQLEQAVRIGILTANLSQDRRDNPADPHRGIYNTVAVGLASNVFGSQRSFGRALVRNATYHRLTHTIVLARQTQFGVIVPFAPPAGISGQQSVPLPERFFGGGADTLRAFPYNQAGPRDTGVPLVPGGPSSQPTGFPLGGNALFYNNVELRFPLIGSNINGVLFHDMGNVFTSLGNMSLSFHQPDLQHFDYTVHAAGFGIRYKTPLGPVRLDLAYSINPPAFVGFKGTANELLQCNPNATQPTSACVGVPQRVSHFQFFFSIGQTF